MRPVPCSLLLLLLVATMALATSDNHSDSATSPWKGFSVACLTGQEEQVEGNANSSPACHGIRLVRKIVQKMLEDARRKRSLEIVDGVSLVVDGDEVGSMRNARVMKNFGAIGSVLSFLENRELRIKLRSLLPDNLEEAVNASLAVADQGRGHKGGKKGDGMMMMVLMMGKMLAAMGFGALSLLAMKALMVSALALMLSLIVAAKKLSSKDDHHIVYTPPEHHHRRRRSLPLTSGEKDSAKNQPYRGYPSPAWFSGF